MGFQEQFLELLFRFHGTLRRLQLQEPEYVLMAAMALFSPGEHPKAQKLLLLHPWPNSQPCESTHKPGFVFKPSLHPFDTVGARLTQPVLPCPPSYRQAWGYPEGGD